MASGKTCSAVRIMASSNRLSVYPASTPREIWIMNGAAYSHIYRILVLVHFTQITTKQPDGLFQIVDVVSTGRNCHTRGGKVPLW